MVAVLTLASLFAISLVYATEAKKQGMCVLGKLTCSSDPSAIKSTMVKLYDKDRGNTDDLMAEGKPTEDGFFEVCGTASDVWGDIDPLFKIYTRCKYTGDNNCYRRIVYKVDKQWINKNLEFEEEIDLSKPIADEDIRCFTGSVIQDYFLKLKNSFSGR